MKRSFVQTVPSRRRRMEKLPQTRQACHRLLGERLEPRLVLAGPQFVEHPFIISGATDLVAVHAADVDGDGDVDVLSGDLRGEIIAWTENTDGAGTFGLPQLITTDAQTRLPGSVNSADLDGDGDLDVLSMSWFTPGEIAWHENTDGSGNFGGPPHLIDNIGNGAFYVSTADFDTDGDLDVLGFSAQKKIIAWYENTDGLGTFDDGRVVITRNVLWPNSVYAADFNGDGDPDVVSGSFNDHKLAWYENTDGEGTFGEQLEISTRFTFPRDIYPADLDGDGDMDVLAASEANARIAWFENTDGLGTFGREQGVRTRGYRPFTVLAADLDGDIDLDIVSTNFADNTKTIVWYENVDGVGNFGPPEVIFEREADRWGSSAVVADLDSDGDLDVLHGMDGKGENFWHENQTVQKLSGDANEDGQFNQLDIVQVLQAGKYDTGEPATFAEGDWNGDGVFDQLDIVAALQTGNFLQGPFAVLADRNEFTGIAKDDGQTADTIFQDDPALDELLPV